MNELTEKLRKSLADLCEAIEDSDLVREVEAGAMGEGPYVLACRLIGREIKWPSDWEPIDPENDEDFESEKGLI